MNLNKCFPLENGGEEAAY